MVDDLKRRCAREALKMIEDGMVVGLGGGSTISYLVEYIKAANLKVKVVTPSVNTKLYCLNNGLEVLHTMATAKVDIAFDGCDEVDNDLNALKSGGGIHTLEKLVAAMAEKYVLLVDESKVADQLAFKHPVVLEVLQDALSYVDVQVKALGGKPAIRKSTAKDGFTITENGNLLIDVEFDTVEEIARLEKQLEGICGVIETSLFVDVATMAIVVGDHGIRKITKKYEGKR